MLSRLGRFSLLAFQVVWLLVILPGHQRGAITLPGSPTWCEPASDQSASTHGCCSSPSSSDSESHIPDQDRTSHCAVCHYAIRMVFLAPPDLTISPAGFVELLEAPRAQSQYHQLLIRAHDARGPPQA